MKPPLLRPAQMVRDTLLLAMSIVGLQPKPPLLRLTEAARVRLLQEMSEITQFQPVATVLWAVSSGKGNRVSGEAPVQSNKPGWGVGFYDQATRPWGRITEIQGVPFVFVQKRAFTHLDGATLDYSNGQFVVSESAT